MDVVTVDGTDHVDETVATLTLAFCDDPVARWLFPRATQALEGFPHVVRAYMAEGFAARSARRCAHGAAGWLEPGARPDGPALDAALTRLADPAVLDDAAGFFDQLHEFHPTRDCWHLTFVGVEPGHRDRGVGSALLGEGLARCDAEGASVYLESSNPRNLPLYRRHGFEMLGTVQVGSSPVMIPMLRPAR